MVDRDRTKNNNGCKGDYGPGYIPNIRHLTRVIMYLTDCKEYCNASRIARDCGLINLTLKKSLLWLTNNNILKMRYNNNYKTYGINITWKKLKDDK